MASIFQPIMAFISSIPLWAFILFIWMLAMFYRVGIQRRSFDTTSPEHLGSLSGCLCIFFALSAQYMPHATFTMWGLYYGLSFLVGAGLGWLLGKVSPLYADTKRSLIKAPGVPVIFVFGVTFFITKYYFDGAIEANSELLTQPYVIPLYVMLSSFVVGTVVGCSSCYISRFNAITNDKSNSM